MTLEELANGLESLGYPVVYSHFNSKQTPPFICYIEDSPDILFADNKSIEISQNINIELYTAKKDLEVESKIMEFLNNNDLPFEVSEQIYIESEGIFQRVFYIYLI